MRFLILLITFRILQTDLTERECSVYNDNSKNNNKYSCTTNGAEISGGNAPVFLAKDVLEPTNIVIQNSKFSNIKVYMINNEWDNYIISLSNEFIGDNPDIVHGYYINCEISGGNAGLAYLGDNSKLSVENTTVKDIAENNMKSNFLYASGKFRSINIRNSKFSNNMFALETKPPFKIYGNTLVESITFYNCSFSDHPRSKSMIASIDNCNATFEYCTLSQEAQFYTGNCFFDLYKCYLTIQSCFIHVTNINEGPQGQIFQINSRNPDTGVYLVGKNIIDVPDIFPLSLKKDYIFIIDDYEPFEKECPVMLPPEENNPSSTSEENENEDISSESSTLYEATDNDESTTQSSEESQDFSSTNGENEESTLSEIISSTPDEDEAVSSSIFDSSIEDFTSTIQEDIISSFIEDLQASSSSEDQEILTSATDENPEIYSSDDTSTFELKSEIDEIEKSKSEEEPETKYEKTETQIFETINPSTEIDPLTSIFIPTQSPSQIPKPDENHSFLSIFIQDKCTTFDIDQNNEDQSLRALCYTPTNVTEIDFGQINETIETIYIHLSTKLTPSQMIAFSGLNREKGENNGNNENIKNNKNSKNIKNNENNKNQENNENQENQESHDNQKKYKISIQGISSEISEMYVDLASNNNIYEMNFSSLSIIFVGNHIESSVLNLGEDLILNKGNQNPKINISTVLETYFKHLRYYDYFIIDPNTEQTFNSGEYNIIEVHSNYILFNKSDSKEPYKYEARTNKPIRIESSEERIEFNVHKSDHFVILSLINLIFSTKSEIIVNALKSVQGEKFGLEMNQQTVSLKYSSSNIPVTVFGSGRLVIETPNESTNVKSIKTTDISHSDHLNISNFSINNEFSLIIPENIKSVYTNSITAIGLHPSLDVHYLHKSNFLNKEDSKKNHIKIVVQNLIIEKDSRIQIINSISIEKKIDIFEGGLVSFSRIPEFSISVEIDIVYSHKYKQRSPIISFETFSQEESRYENITISKMNFIHGLFSTQNSEGETISDDELYLEKILIIPMKKEEISKLSFIDSRNKYSKTSENEFLVATLSSSKSNSSTTIIAVVVVIVIVVVIALIIIVVILIKKKKNRQSSDYQDEFDTESTSFSI